MKLGSKLTLKVKMTIIFNLLLVLLGGLVLAAFVIVVLYGAIGFVVDVASGRL